MMSKDRDHGKIDLLLCVYFGHRFTPSLSGVSDLVAPRHTQTRRITEDGHDCHHLPPHRTSWTRDGNFTHGCGYSWIPDSAGKGTGNKFCLRARIRAANFSCGQLTGRKLHSRVCPLPAWYIRPSKYGPSPLKKQ
jgi:hypothetical protein